MSILELKTGLVSREAAYRLLSACYYQPCPEWNQSQLLSNLVSLSAAVSPQMAAAAQIMSDAWNVADVDELTVEYARLFVGPLVLQAPPYGSVYLEHDKQVMGASTLAVMQFYRAAGLSMDAEFTEMPDHIAVELEFVSYLLQRAAAEDNQADIMQWLDQADSFRGRFLGPWYRRFCAAIRSNSDHPFYQALADTTDLLISAPLPKATP
jgi:TorA maturation chaperone TorD